MNAQIERAVEHFRALLEEQLRRVERMESASAQDKAANPQDGRRHCRRATALAPSS